MKGRILSVLLAGAIALQAGMVTVFAKTAGGEGTLGVSVIPWGGYRLCGRRWKYLF